MNKRLCASVGLISLVAGTAAYAVPDACDGGDGLISGTSNITSANLFAEGTDKADRLGVASAVGDFNGDGKQDLAVSAPGDDTNGANSGAVYVFFGPVTNASPAAAAATLVGEAASTFTGASLANGGDLDGDGRDDLIVGSAPDRYSAYYQGLAYVASGAVISGGGVIDLGVSADARFSGLINDDGFGEAVGAGDVNDDGVLDVIVGAPRQDAGGVDSGAVYVFFGPVTSGTGLTADLRVAGPSAGAGFGTAVAGGVDVDGDTATDLIVGAPFDNTGAPKAGSARVFYGGPALTGAMSAASASDVTIVGNIYDRYGFSVSAAGDVDADGTGDFWVGSKQFGGTKRGAAYLHTGETLAPGGSFTADGAATSRLKGEDANDLAGSSVCGNIDLNDDGIADAIIGGERADGAVLQSGAAWVVYGPFPADASLATAAGAKISGTVYKDFVGASCSAGDLNFDGFADAVVGGWGHDKPGATGAGELGVVFGGDDAADLLTFYADADLDGYGNAGVSTTACALPPGYSARSTDCNDASNVFHPGAAEGCSDPDYNCDGFTGNVDNDGDGFDACEECDDRDADISPDATEICGDDIDNDCDGGTDDANASDAMDWCPDVDGDGYGNTTLCVHACEDPGTFLGTVVNQSGDCNDGSATVNPDVAEVCDLIDNNCDSFSDEATAIDALPWYHDTDGDGFGAYRDFVWACSQPPGYTTNADDCDDGFATINPSTGDEVCDYKDNDCNGMYYLGGPDSVDNARLYLQGSSALDQFGSAVTFLGDQDADGDDEIVFGAPFNNDLADDAGAVYLRRGDNHGGDWALSELRADGSGYWDVRIRGTRRGGFVGDQLTQGDVNGDGTMDLVIGAYSSPTPNYEQGGVYVFYGPIADGDYEITDANLQLKGDAQSDLFGKAIATGDVNGDGIDDIVVGAPGVDAPLNRQGAVFVFFGATGLVGEKRGADANAKFLGTTETEEAGYAVAVFNADGDLYADIAVGSHLYGALDQGAVHVVYGSGTMSGTLTAAGTLTGGTNLEELGVSLATAGDATGDGGDELLIGGKKNRAFLMHGSSGVRWLTGTRPSSDVAWIFEGPGSSSAGQFVAPAGDPNADGFADFLIAAHRTNVTVNNEGTVYLVYGEADYTPYKVGQTIPVHKVESFARLEGGNPTPVYSASNLVVPEGARLAGGNEGDQLGRAVAGGGDFNGDGFDDVAAGAPRQDIDANNDDAGAGYVWLAGPFGVDNNDQADIATQGTYFWDWDADEYVDENLTTFVSCPLHVPWSFRDPENPLPRGLETWTAPLDCNDTDYTIHPGAREIRGDGIDSDCDTFDNINNPATATVNITPNPAYASSDLVAVVVANDADGDPVTESYQWFVNGAPVVGATTNTLSSTLHGKGDVVRIEVMLDDTREISGPFTASATVRNSLPTLDSCQITPATAGVITDLTASVVNLNDADVDDVGSLSTTYQWQQRFGPIFSDIPGETGQSLASCADRNTGSTYDCFRGSILRVQCTPWDSTEAGIEYTSTPLTITNTVPVVTNCQINPTSADTTTNLSVIASATDSDNDSYTLSYAWLRTRNSVTTTTAITASTFPSSETEHFDSIQVRCTATDSAGGVSTAVTSTPVVIANTPPGSPVVDLTPNSPRSNQDITVSVITPAPDIDGDTISYLYAWTEDGSPFANPGNTVTAASLDRDEVWEVTVTANDGYVNGGSDSDVVTIRNTPPTITNVTVSPSSFDTTDTITVAAVGWADTDGDLPRYLVTWYVNGSSVLNGENQMSLGPSYFVRDDVITVDVRAYDGENGTLISKGPYTVVNAPPAAPTLQVLPATPNEDSTLTCSVVSQTPDPDGDTITYTYTFYSDGPNAVVAGNTVAPALTTYAENWYCTALPNDGFEDGDLGTSPSKAIQDQNAPPAPVITATDRYRNEDTFTLSGTCTSGTNDCNTMTLTCNDGVGPTAYNPSCTGDAWSQVVSVVRGRTASCSLVCTDIGANNSLASNTVTTEVCSPVDPYDDPTGIYASNYGDANSSPVDEWAAMADNNSTSLTITGNVIGSDSVDWYFVDTTDNPVSDAAAGVDTYKFEVEMTVGASDYDLTVYQDDPNGAAECSTTAPYDDFSWDVADQGDAPDHALPGNLNACSASGPPSVTGTWSLYNLCEDHAYDWYVKVQRGLGSNCQAYQLRVYNGRP